MKLIRLTLVNYKRMLKEKSNLAIMLVMPLAIIAMVYFLTNNTSGTTDMKVAFNVLDKGTYAEAMLDNLGFKDYIYINDNAQAMKSLENNDVAAVYEIPKSFTEDIKNAKTPKIKSYKRETAGTAKIIEDSLNYYIFKKIREQLLLSSGLVQNIDNLYELPVKANIVNKNRDMSTELYMAVYLIIYFIILSANAVGTEIINMKKSKVLMRAATTATKGYVITGSVYLSMFLLQTSIYLLVLFLSKLIFGYVLTSLPIIMLNIVLASLISISLGLAITRVSDNPTVATYILTLICIVTTLLSVLVLSGNSIRETPQVLQNIAKFTPQYWLLDSIDKLQIFPNALILLLMATALFTAGNFRLRSFINR